MTASIDLKGRTFGRLEVLYRLPNKHGGTSWWCRCVCGVEKEVTGNQLRFACTRSCGCLQREMAARRCKETPPRQLPPYEWLHRDLVRVANEREIPISLSFSDLLTFIPTPTCYYCGDPVVWHPHCVRGETTAANLDRKDNSLGYTKENCVVCCPRCNWMKSNLPVEAFLQHCKKIAERWV